MISAANTKGGVGKTTTAMYLANEYARAGREVTVVDLDKQGSASVWADKASDRGTPLPFAVEVSNTKRISRLADSKGSDHLIVIDTPPGDSSVIEGAIDVSDFVIIPTTPSELDTDRVWETIPTVRDGQLYGVLVASAVLHTRLLNDVITALDENEVSRFKTVVSFAQRYRQAVGYRPRRDATYADVAEEIGAAL
ncbi:chromosome partitioning protein ParA [Williamsia sp. 1135]|nr:chromosome partitioning protein ParA [Williamsia sp. 1135]